MGSSLPPGYFVECLNRPDEIERLASLSGEIHGGAGVAEMTRKLAFAHPIRDRIRWLAVVEEESRDIAATLSLIPWTIMYEDVELPAAEMGIVGTRETQRRRGHMRALVAEFNETAAEEGYLLSHIQGIPWFYRQFGYEYAVPLETNIHLEFRHIPDTAEGPDIRLRQASDSDTDFLDTCYRESVAGLGLFALRSPAYWKYLLGASMQTDYASDTYIVETETKSLGYCRIPRHGFGEGLILGECSNLPLCCYPRFFLRIKELALKSGKPFIRLNLGPASPAVLAAKDLGAVDRGGYAWQIRITDPAGFLHAVAPVIERRLEGSGFAGYSGGLEIDLYKEKVSVHFSSGKISAITNKKAASDDKSGAVVHMPPNLFAPIVLGQKSYTECALFYPDLSAGEKTVKLLSVLFPGMNGFFHCPY